MTDMQENTFHVIADEIAAMKKQHWRYLQAEMYRDNVAFYASPSLPVSWRTRCRRRVVHVRHYVSTLWDALRGRDPYEYDD